MAIYYPPKPNRAKVMAEMRKKGLTLERIGKRYQLTRERVRQILKKLAEDEAKKLSTGQDLTNNLKGV